MAILKSNSLGFDLTGGFGDFYVRNQNGKKVICKKPVSYKPSMGVKSVKSRSSFSCTGSLSKVITKEPFFHELWKSYQENKSIPYRKFISFNHPHDNALVLSNIKLSPYPENFKAEVESYLLTKKSFKITFKAMNNDCGINFEREPFVSAGGFILLADSNPKRVNDVTAVGLKRASLKAAQNTAFSFELDFTAQAFDKINDYSQKTIVLLLSTLNSEEQPVKHSQTFAITQD